MTDALQILILSGPAGSGRTTALHAVEDVGFFCVDNLPVELFSTFITLADENPATRRVAISAGVRDEHLHKRFTETLEGLRSRFEVQVLFVDCDDDRLKARFKETRRPHPLISRGEATTLTEAIALERERLAAISREADARIDTSRLTVHDLKRTVQDRFGELGATSMRLHVMSFGFRHGVPQEADWVFDVRYFDNPHFVAELRPKTGRDPAVRDYVLTQKPAEKLRTHVLGIFKDVIPLVDDENRAQLTIAIGCTGGKHRSVALADAIAGDLNAALGRPVTITHRDKPPE